MRKLLSIFILVFLASLLIGCSGGNGVVPPPPEEEIPVELIREYTGRDNVVRWPDGVVPVCDTTEKTGTIWQEINKAIDGPVSFQLTADTMAEIGIEYFDIEFPFFFGISIEGFEFTSYGVGIHSMVKPEDIDVYTQICLIGAGISEQKAALGLTEDTKKVLFWLYRLEPGYLLI
jgi:hypothetical protein